MGFCRASQGGRLVPTAFAAGFVIALSRKDATIPDPLRSLAKKFRQHGDFSACARPAPPIYDAPRRRRQRHLDLRWGHSSVGRALEWHSRGQGFDSPWLHQIISQNHAKFPVNCGDDCMFCTALRPVPLMRLVADKPWSRGSQHWASGPSARGAPARSGPKPLLLAYHASITGAASHSDSGAFDHVP